MSFLSDFKYGFAILSYDDLKQMELKDGQLKSFIALVISEVDATKASTHHRYS